MGHIVNFDAETKHNDGQPVFTEEETRSYTFALLVMASISLYSENLFLHTSRLSDEITILLSRAFDAHTVSITFDAKRFWAYIDYVKREKEKYPDSIVGSGLPGLVHVLCETYMLQEHMNGDIWGQKP